MSNYSLGACIWCLHSAHTNLSSHTGRHNKQVLSHPPRTHDRYNCPNVQYHCLFLSSPWTLFILFTSVDTIPFTSVDTVYFFHILFIGDRSLHPITSLRTWVSTPPVVSTRLIPSGRACLGVPEHHACSTYMLSLHPRFNLWSRLLPITQFPCRSAHNLLSYQSKCRSVMYTLYLSITHFKLSISVSKKS